MEQPTDRAQQLTDEIVAMIPLLRIYARSLLRGTDSADDLVQETLVRAIANVHRFEIGTNLRAWLFTIMRNTFITASQKYARERPAAEDCASLEPMSMPTHDARLEERRVVGAINRLPQQYRGVIIRVLVRGDSYEDTATLFGCPIGTIKSRVNRGRQLVIEAMGVSSIRDFSTVS
jgi:RNA polymerase sigma-70 factor (ECF subfamily)